MRRTFLMGESRVFCKEQLSEVQRAMLVHMPKDVILSYFYPETPVTKMMEIRKRYE